MHLKPAKCLLCKFYLFCFNELFFSIESFRPPIFRSGPDKAGFTLGRTENFREVFGEDVAKWFLPIHTR